MGVVGENEGLDFKAAVNWIADEAGLPRWKQDPEAEKRYEAVRSVSEIYTQTFQDSLTSAEPALAYLEKRGISRETTIGKVGYLPANFKPPDVEAAKLAGLLSKNDNFLFSGRVIIPVYQRGQIVSLYGRAVKDCAPEHRHRYPCTTDPPMPSTLWNLDACRGLKEVYFAEKIIDAMTLIDRGFMNSMGLFGTQGLTDSRLEALKKTSIEKITLCFDTDLNRSGQDGALKAGEKLFRAGYDVRILELPLDSGQKKIDLNSYFLTESKEAFAQLTVRLFFDYLLDTVPTSGSIIERYRALKPILQLISDLPELMWKELINILSARFPALDRRKLEKEVSQYRKQSVEVQETSKRFRPLDCVDKILEKEHLISFDGRTYRYGNGVYSPWHPEQIDQVTIELVGQDCQPSHLDAVRKFLNSVTFVPGERVNPRGLLNLKNGVLDLPSLSFTEHSFEIFFTVQSETVYDRKADCPLWRKTICQILPDPQVRALLAQIFGCSLTADNSLHKAFLFYGDGENGKSLVTDVLEALAGRLNCSALHLADFKERFRLAELQNKLINFS